MTMRIELPASPAGGRRWYVFRSVARQEGLAEANLAHQGFTYFLPKVCVTKRHARRYITQREWLFPRYGFVRIDLMLDRWRSINGTYGVEQLVMGRDGPLPVPEGVVEALQAVTDAAGLFAAGDGLSPGATVRVRQGPLSGRPGTLQALDGRGRVELLLDLMNGQVRVTVNREWIEVIPQ